jgi:hypothetical protein
LDSLAERYGVLPSVLLSQADTMDLWVYDVANSYRKLQQDRQTDPLAGMDLTELAGSLKQKRQKNEHSETDN